MPLRLKYTGEIFFFFEMYSREIAQVYDLNKDLTVEDKTTSEAADRIPLTGGNWQK